jgi:hypothetical protein
MVDRFFSHHFARVGNLVGRQTPFPTAISIKNQRLLFFNSRNVRMMASMAEIGSFKAKIDRIF